MKFEGAEAVCSYGSLSLQVSGMCFIAGPPARSERVMGSADVRVAKAVSMIVERSIVMNGDSVGLKVTDEALVVYDTKVVDSSTVGAFLVR